MTPIVWITVLAILLSPIIALLISMYLQTRKERKKAKMYLFSTLISTRHSPITEETVRALNMIDVLFYDKPKVRQLWREYFEMLYNEGLNNPLGWEQRQKKNIELIHEMGKCLGYGKSISHLDVERVYYPVGLGQQRDRIEELFNELLRVLKTSGGITITPRKTDGGENK